MFSKLRPPQPAPRWDHTPATIATESAAAIASAKATYDAIASLPPTERTFDAVFGAFALARSTLLCRGPMLAFYRHVGVEKEVRDAGRAARAATDEAEIERKMRLDLYEVLKDAMTRARFADRLIKEGKMNGLELAEERRSELSNLRKKLSSLCTAVQRHNNEESGQIVFTAAELEGVPTDVVSGHPRLEDEKMKVTFKTPDIMPLLKYAKNPDTRQRAWIAFESPRTCYSSWADYAVDLQLIKKAQPAVDFIEDLEAKLRPIGEKDLAKLLGLKSEEEGSGGVLNVWDSFYYDRLHVERTLSVDHNLIKEYFPVETVVPAILKIYQELLGVEFIDLSSNVDAGDVWHTDVQRFAVWNMGSQDDNGFIGYAYLDLYPRQGKYGHAAVWQIAPVFEMSGGRRHYPITAMVANLAKPTPDRPALMTHDNVVTFFHEMGHIFHNLLSKTRYYRFHGTSVAGDFVEAPSQMLENWCWNYEVLARMSSHYKTGEPLSGTLIEALVQSRYASIGLSMLRQLFHGKFDMMVHMSQEPQDYAELWLRLRESTAFLRGPTVTPPVPGHTAFGHLTSGYDARYYGYAYSLVFAADMYASVFKTNPLSAEAGRKCRREILEPGSSRDEMESLKAFLGREPNANAFIEQIQR